MRYRIGEDPANATVTSTEPALLFTVLLSLVIGIVLVALGVKGRQIWLTVWSAGLIVASLAYLAWVLWTGTY